MATGHEGEDGESELRVILVGKGGAGKSATGKTILGRKEFESRIEPAPTTLKCQKVNGTWKGRTVDTAAIFDSEALSGELEKEVVHCKTLSQPGPDALVFVTQVGRFTAEDKAAVKQVEDVFGVGVTKHMVVSFTHKEDLEGGSLRDYVMQSGNKALQELIRECGGHFCAPNNRAEGAERERQGSDLIQVIEKMVQENGGSHYVIELDAKSGLPMAENSPEKISTCCIWSVS